MKFLLFSVILTACAASPQDLSDKMFTFPKATDTAHIRLITSREDFRAITVCLRSFTDIKRPHGLFSLATPTFANGFLIMKETAADQINLYNVGDNLVAFNGQDYKLNTWHSLCATWESQSGLGQLWLDGKPSARLFLSSGRVIEGNTVITLGQDQDSHGGGFDANQSFVGMLTDVHMWDHVLSPCEIQRYMDDLNFTPGNVLNWRALEFQIRGNVVLETKQVRCDSILKP